LVIDVGGPATRKKELITMLESRKGADDRVPIVVFIDGIPKASASVFKP
jgi:hypothetical protein